MDQNTNNSFTSAPQGGDFSDIIIPNAYAAKPKGKNLKKYVVFGVIGAVAMILISLIVKAIFVDSRTMSKEEFIKMANSEDIANIEGLENFFYVIYENRLQIKDIFNEERFSFIQKYDKSIHNIKSTIDRKKQIDGNESAKKEYVLFCNQFNDRYKYYIEAINTYYDFYNSYNNLNIEIIDKYKNKTEYQEFIQNFIELIDQKMKIQKLIESNECSYQKGQLLYSDYCTNQERIKNSIIDDINNLNKSRVMFNMVYKIENYDKMNNLVTYVDNINNELR